MSQIIRKDYDIERLGIHPEWCTIWADEECDCPLSLADSYMDDEPPIRQSKSAKPKHRVSGRSIFTILDKIKRGGK